MSRIPRFAAPALLLLALLAVPAAAGATPDLSNSQAAQACQKGGFQNFTRADGTPFANAGECDSYTAQGGVFLPVVRLPDLVPGVACKPTPTAHTVTCVFTIVNVGAGAATGLLLLNTTLAIPVGDSISLSLMHQIVCPGDAPSDLWAEVTTTSAAAELYAGCRATLLPGEEASLVIIIGASTGTVGTPLTFAATVDPDNAIEESNEGNNTYNAVITNNAVVRTP